MRWLASVNNMPFNQLEEAYDLLAKAIDDTADNGSLLLAKVCMILINQSGDIELVKQAIAEAKQNP